MTTRSSQFGVYFRDHLTEQIDRLIEQVQASTSKDLQQSYLIPTEDLKMQLSTALSQIAEAIASENNESLIAFAGKIGLENASENVSIAHMMNILGLMRGYIWDYLLPYMKEHQDYQPEDIRPIEETLHMYQGAYFGSFRGYYEQLQRSMLTQQEELERQHNLVQELGTPIVPVYEGILLIPLVGQINEFRAMRVTEQVLEAIVQQQADVLLIDITGVPVVDTSIASHLMTLTRAVRLLGTDVIMVGLGAEIAQTIVHLGINLNGIATLANLQDGLVEALQRRGLSIRNRETVAV